MLNSLEPKVYELQLRELDAFSFEKIRSRSDMIAIFRYLKGCYCMCNVEQGFFLLFQKWIQSARKEISNKQ